MIKKHYLIVLFLIAIVLYFNQEYVFGNDTLVEQLLLLFILGVNMFYALKCILLKRRDSVVKYVTIFIVVHFVWLIYQNLVIMALPSEITIPIFKSTLLAMTSLFPFYYWGLKGIDINRPLILFFALYLCYKIYGFLYAPQEVSDQEYKVVNVGYSFLALLPFVYLFRTRPLVATSIVFIIMALIIGSSKRGAIACSSIFLIIYIYYSLYSRKTQLWRKFLVFALLVAGVIWTWHTLQDNEYVVSRFVAATEGDSSGRNLIFENIWTKWSTESNATQTFLGYGYCASSILTGDGHFAHNDWLEILAGFGIFGVIIYMLTLRSMILPAFDRNRSVASKYIIFSIMAIWTMQTLFSMSYLSETNFLLSMLLGYTIGNESKYKTIII